VNIDAFEVLKANSRDNNLEWLNATKLISFGVVIQVVNRSTVIVESVVRTSATREIYAVPLITPGSNLLEVSVEPVVGDLVLLLFQQNYHPSMFNDPRERFDAVDEWSIYDTEYTKTGYSKFTGLGILLRAARDMAATSICHFTSGGGVYTDINSSALIMATLKKELSVIFDGAPDGEELKERLISFIFSPQNPYSAHFLSRVERLYGFDRDTDNELIEHDAAVTEKYSVFAPITRSIQGLQAADTGLGEDAEGNPIETDAPITETIHGKAPVVRNIRSPQTITVGIGNDESGDTEEQRDAPVTVNMGEKAGITLTSKSGAELHFDKAIALDGGETLDLTFTGNVTLSGESDVVITFGGDGGFKASAAGLLEIGNSIATLGAMISDLLDALIQFQSSGSPGLHTAPALTAAATQIKAKWNQVFK
jgi:hypothetical protein